MSLHEQIATWMVSQFKGHYLYQDDIVWALNKQFGDDATYQNDNGNLAINKNVLKEFKKITNEKVVWERGGKAWRKLKPTEAYTGRQQD
jgi:hypothetical protein